MIHGSRFDWRLVPLAAGYMPQLGDLVWFRGFGPARLARVCAVDAVRMRVLLQLGPGERRWDNIPMICPYRAESELVPPRIKAVPLRRGAKPKPRPGE
jgi:hypothetical protein